MKKIFFFLFVSFIATSILTQTTYAQTVCAPQPQGRMSVQVPFQGVVLPTDQNGRILSGVYQASVYVLRTPGSYTKVINVIYFIAGNNTPFEINGAFTKPPSDWNGYFLESEQGNLRNLIYESGSSYRNANGSSVIMGGDYIVPKRIPALLHVEERGVWAELLVR